MGTYPIPKVAEARGSGTRTPRNKRKTRKDIFTAFDYALAHPEETLTEIGPQFGVGGSTLANWINPPHKGMPNKHVIAWLKGRDILTLDGSGPTNVDVWARERPRNVINQRVLDAVRPQRKARVKVVSPETDVGHDPLVGPTGIGTFVPAATDDLLVLKEEALKVKAEAEAVALEATTLSIAIDTIRDWMTDKDRLQLALGRIESLEQQLKNADEIAKRFQQQKLASGQVHSSD